MRALLSLIALFLAWLLFGVTYAHANHTTGNDRLFALGDTSCAVLSTTASGNHLYCWGARPPGGAQVIPGDFHTRPVRMVQSGSVRQMGRGLHNYCLLTNDDVLRCGGTPDTGVIVGVPFGSPYVQDVVSSVSNIRAFSIGDDSTICAINTSNALSCWGLGAYGQLGNGIYGYVVDQPQQVIGMDSGVSDVAVGYAHACAIRNGALYCWGDNTFGQVGIPAPPITHTPSLVTGMATGVKRVIARGNITCAIRDAGGRDDLYCWGENKLGGLYLGVGPSGHTYTPTLVITDVRGATVRGNGGCAIRSDNSVYCWGDNGTGQVGDGTTDPRYRPVQVPVSATHIAAAWFHVLARGTDGCIYAWGNNDYGKLGEGGTASRYLSPVLADRTCMGNFAKRTPSDLSTLRPLTLSLGWNHPDQKYHVDHYRYAITSAAQPNIIFTSVGLNTDVQLSNLPPDTEHRWQVRACADPECLIFRGADNFTWHSFRTAPLPGAFSKTEPADNSYFQFSVFNSTLLFRWTPAQHALGYLWCMDYAEAPPCEPNRWTTNTFTSEVIYHPGRSYRWHVVACGDAECTARTSSGNYYLFTVMPMPFAKLSPANGAIVPSTTLRLIWEGQQQPHHYRYCLVRAHETCLPSEIVSSNSTSVTVYGLIPGQEYRWDVVACADEGCVHRTGSDLSWTFSIMPAPPPLSKEQPLNNAQLSTTTITLRWSPASATHGPHYYYCVSRSPGCIPQLGGGTTSSVTVSNLVPGATYYWQVAACRSPGPDGRGENCTPADNGVEFSFRLPITPAAFGKLSPVHQALSTSLDVSLQWSPSADAHHYRYCLSTTPGCVPEVVVGTALEAMQNGLEAETTYYWQVRACADAECQIFTDANNGTHWHFRTSRPLLHTSKTLPADNAQITTTLLMLRWNHLPQAHHYRYCVHEEGATSCVPQIQTSTPFAFISGLLSGRTYRWQVRACGDASCQIFADADNGQEWRFSVSGGATSLNKRMPANDASGLGKDGVVLVWDAVSGVHHYRYCYSTTPNCAPTQNTNVAMSDVLNDLTPGATYFWQVRACADAGCTVWRDADEGTYHRFTVAALPVPFSKTLPAHQAVVSLSPAVGFTWTAQAGVHHYRFCIAPHDQPSCTPLFPFAPPSLQRGMAYRWQVRACADAGCTVWRDADEGAHHSFLVASAPFGKSWPYDLSAHDEVTLTLRWRESEGAAAYRYCVVDTPGACESAWVSAGGALSATVGGLVRGQTYHWQVQACADAACREPVAADDGRVWRFSVRTPGEVISTHRALSMTLVEGSRFGWPTRYLVEVRNPLSEQVALTLTVGVPAMSEFELVEGADGDGWMTAQASRWGAVLYPGGRAAYTVTLRHRPETPSQLLTGRVVTPLVALGDGTAQAMTTHPVEPNRAYLPLARYVQACQSGPMPPDNYEPDDAHDASNIPLLVLGSGPVSRNLHQATDVDHIRLRVDRQPNRQAVRLSFRFSSGGYGQKVEIYHIQGNQLILKVELSTTYHNSAPYGEISLSDNMPESVEYLVRVSASEMRPGYCQTVYDVRME